MIEVISLSSLAFQGPVCPRIAKLFLWDEFPSKHSVTAQPPPQHFISPQLPLFPLLRVTGPAGPDVSKCQRTVLLPGPFPPTPHFYPWALMRLTPGALETLVLYLLRPTPKFTNSTALCPEYPNKPLFSLAVLALILCLV